MRRGGSMRPPFFLTGYCVVYVSPAESQRPQFQPQESGAHAMRDFCATERNRFELSAELLAELLAEPLAEPLAELLA